ncbi:hypothetical protein HanPSC8_Chr07g0286191 [Helianthus annuus]|nr:hypothetical protein HanPSC8_Chr07g0286191 [Helianthus annuus]
MFAVMSQVYPLASNLLTDLLTWDLKADGYDDGYLRWQPGSRVYWSEHHNATTFILHRFVGQREREMWRCRWCQFGGYSDARWRWRCRRW